MLTYDYRLQLASKLAASQAPGGYPGAGAPPAGAYPPQSQKAGAYPGQNQYQAYPGASSYYLPSVRAIAIPSDKPTMTHRPYQPYPGQLNSQGSQPPYSSASSQPPYPQSSQPQQYSQQPSYGQQPPYNNRNSYQAPPPPPPPQQYGGYPPQTPYGQPAQGYQRPPYPPNPGPVYGQQGQYPPQQQGGYPGQGGQQYGAAPPQQQYGGAPPQQAGAYKQMLQACVQENHLQALYPPNDQRIDMYANKAVSQVDQLCAKWRVPREIGQDIVKLALYDAIIYIDNSGSMKFEENGERIKDLKLILSRVSYAASLFDDDGIQVRFMNAAAAGVNPAMLNGIRNEQQAEALADQAKYSGLTPLGTELRNQIIEPLVLQRARSGQLRKPILIITITDGQPAGEPPKTLEQTIALTGQELGRMPQYGKHACKFQFAQVGNDQAAKAFLAELDEKREFGDVVDCTSNFENEQEEMLRANPPVDLTPELWLVKLLLGAIDKSYDTQDEKSSAPQSYGGAPPGQYGAPPPGQYGAPPQGQYGAPPQGQYGAPPPGQYGQPQGGYPPQQQGYGQPPQPAYGRPPPPAQGQGGYQPQQGGGYPGQQGGYGAPPPPPRY